YRNNVLLSNSSAALSINSSGTYKCVITSGSCTVTTNSVVGNQINNPTPSITTTTPTTFCAPGSVVLTANSFAGVQYQWQKNSVDIVGATAQNYTATSNGSYRVIETANGCSKSKTINVNAASSVSASIYTNDPTTLCNQGSVTMHVNIPIPGYSYQWKNNGNNISGATATSYTTNVSGNYSCNVSASCGNTNNNAIIVSIGSFNAQISPSGSQILCTGGSMLLSASSGIGFTHQWYKNGNAISGATSSTYSATSGGSYTVFISSPCGSGTSPAAVLTENTVSASVSPAGTSTVCAGIPFTFTANSGAGYSYRWYRNNVLLAGTGQSINATSAGQYKVEVSINGSCAVISNIAVLDVINNPAPVISPANATICNGAAQVFTANNFTGVTYQWYRNSVLIPGATAQTYSATLAGQYKVTQTANGCYKSKSAQLTVTSCREEGEGFIAEAQSNISISPNPFTDQLNIYVPSEKDGNAEIQVLDMLGKVVYRSVITLNQTSEINLHVPAGIYMLSVHTDGKYQVQKIVKSR
ncbi:MAG TPA: T9SS type A sorting domain-containing protein, partial [Bacteroidia bacterium]|nr:T9SS type A sorting domain-containing protein [Bacteroidia bacterium]